MDREHLATHGVLHVLKMSSGKSFLHSASGAVPLFGRVQLGSPMAVTFQKRGEFWRQADSFAEWSYWAVCRPVLLDRLEHHR